jgi:hypothetical protein
VPRTNDPNRKEARSCYLRLPLRPEYFHSVVTASLSTSVQMLGCDVFFWRTTADVDTSWAPSSGVFRIRAAQADWRDVLKKNAGRYPETTLFTITSAYFERLGFPDYNLTLGPSGFDFPGQPREQAVMAWPARNGPGNIPSPRTLWRITNDGPRVLIEAFDHCNAYDYDKKVCTSPAGEKLQYRYLLTAKMRGSGMSASALKDGDDKATQRLELYPAYGYITPVPPSAFFGPQSTSGTFYCNTTAASCSIPYLDEFARGAQYPAGIALDLELDHELYARAPGDLPSPLSLTLDPYSGFKLEVADNRENQRFVLDRFEEYFDQSGDKHTRLLTMNDQILGGDDVALVPSSAVVIDAAKRYGEGRSDGFSHYGPFLGAKFAPEGKEIIVTLYQGFGAGYVEQFQPMCARWAQPPKLDACDAGEAPSRFLMRYVDGAFQTPVNQQ